MKGYRKKITAALLTATLAAGSFASVPVLAQESEQGAAMGRYIEEEIKLPEAMMYANDMNVLEDGSVAVLGLIDQGEGYTPGLYTLAAGSSEWELSYTLDTVEPYKARISRHGDVFIEGNFIEENGQEDLTAGDAGEEIEASTEAAGTAETSIDDLFMFSYIHVDPAGNMQEVSLDFLGEESDENFFIDFCYTAQGQVLGADLTSGKMYLFDDTTGEVVQTIEQTTVTPSMVWELNGKAWKAGYGEAEAADLTTGEYEPIDAAVMEEILNEDNTLVTTTSSYPMLAAAGTDGAEYFCTKDGLYRHTAGGAVVEQLLDGSLSQIGSPDFGYCSMAQANDGSFYILGGGAAPTLLHLLWSEDTPSVPEHVLRLYSLCDNMEMRQAVMLFQKEHPDYLVKMEIGMSGAATLSDALRTLNTDLLAGNGPDVLLLDGMNIRTYIEKGILADLTETLALIAESDGFFETMKNIYATEQGTFAVPARFVMGALQGTQETLAQIDGLTSFADQVQRLHEEHPEDKEVLLVPTYDIYQMLDRFYGVYSAKFLQEDGSVNEEAIREFVTQAKRCFDVNDNSEYGTVLFSMDEMWEQDYDMRGISMYWGEAAMGGSQKVGIGTIGAPGELTFLAAMKDDTGIDYCMAGEEGKNVFLPSAIVGVNAMGNQIEAAKELAAFLFGTEAQSVCLDTGFPINRAAFDAIVEKKTQAGENAGGITSYDGETFIEITPRSLTEEEKQTFVEGVENASLAALTDATIKSLVIEQTGNYLMGYTEEDGAVNAIIQKINLYLAE